MKRILGLLIYTLAVIGGSYLFRNSSQLPTILYVLTALACFGVIGLLVPGGSSQGATGRGFGPGADVNYIKASQGERNTVMTNVVDVISTLYLIVPFIIAIFLFAN